MRSADSSSICASLLNHSASSLISPISYSLLLVGVTFTAEVLASNADLVLDCVKENGSYGLSRSCWTCLSAKKLLRRGFEVGNSS